MIDIQMVDIRLRFRMVLLETRDYEALLLPFHYQYDRARIRNCAQPAVVELVFEVEDDGGVDAARLHHFPETFDPLACIHHSVTSSGPWFLSCVNMVTTISTMIAAGTDMMTELMPVDCT